MTFLKRNQVLAVSAILLAASGCNIGPDFSPKLGLISGTWTFNAASLQDSDGGEVSCNASGYQVVIDQEPGDSNFTGTYGGGKLTCVLQGNTILDRSASGTIVNGTLGLGSIVSSPSVSFDFDTRDAHQRGNRVGNKMDGTATWRIDFGGDIGSVSLSGQWRAVR